MPGLSLGSSWLLIISFCAFTFLPTPLGLSCGSPSPRLWSLRRCSVRLWLCRSLALGRPPLCHGHFCCRLFARLRGQAFLCFYVDKFLDNLDNLDICWTSFQTICGPILVQFGTRSAQAEAKMGPRGPSRASKTQRGAFPQIQKTFSLCRFLGSKAAQDSLRKPEMDTQDAPKGFQNHKKKASKNGPHLYQLLNHLQGLFRGTLWGQN